MSFATICTMSLAIPAMIAIVRYPVIERKFYPFVILIWVGMANELIALLMIHFFRSNAINNNIYSLLEAFLITWQFRRWNLFRNNLKYYYLLQALFLIAWVAEDFIFLSLHVFNSYFNIIHGFVTVLLSINIINLLITGGQVKLTTNPIFLICIAFILYFTFTILIEIFWRYGFNESRDFRGNIYFILDFINLISNLIFAVALIWMPTKQKYILRS